MFLVQSLFAFTHLGSFCLLFYRPSSLFKVLKRDIILLSLVFFAAASVFWSSNPSNTLYTLIKLMGTTFFGIYLSTRFTSKEIFRFLLYVLGFGAISSLIFAIILPSYGVMSSGEWQGIYRHKNLLGRLMVLNTIFLLLVKSTSLSNNLLNKAMILLSILLVISSSSKGALIYLISLILIASVCKFFLWRDVVAIPAFLISLVLILGVTSWLLSNLEYIVVDVLNKDITLTGRSDIWEAAIEMIGRRPYLGYGYSGFWHGFNGPSEYIIRVTQWPLIPHSHNGFIDLSLELGIVGLCIFCLGLLSNLFKAALRASRIKSTQALWPLIYLLSVLIFNFSESGILKENSIFWVLYVVACFSSFKMTRSSDNNTLLIYLGQKYSP